MSHHDNHEHNYGATVVLATVQLSSLEVVSHPNRHRNRAKKMALEASLVEELCARKEFDVIAEVSSLGKVDLEATKNVVDSVLEGRLDAFERERNLCQPPVSMDGIGLLVSDTSKLDRSLVSHMRMLKQNEGSLISTNDVLEHDAAKAKADRLVEIVKAKITWAAAFREASALDKNEHNEMYLKLVTLQRCHDVLSRYSKQAERDTAFEKMKDEFLSWYSPAVLFAIEDQDVAQLEALREKFQVLNRIHVFETSLGAFARNKIKVFLEQMFNPESGKYDLWTLLQEVFTIWKSSRRIAEQFLDERGSEVVAKNLLEGVNSQWERISAALLNEMSSDKDPLQAAHAVANMCSEFEAYVKENGDEPIHAMCSSVTSKLLGILSDGYMKQVSSVLLASVNRIHQPERASRSRHTWIMVFIEDLFSLIRQLIEDAESTFGAKYFAYVVPSLELAVKEFYSLVKNNDLLGVEKEQNEVRLKKTVQENTEDKISAICVTGYLLAGIDEINEYLTESAKQHEVTENFLISNRTLLETLNREVLDSKADSMALSIIYHMGEEMAELKKQSVSSQAVESLKNTLPSFSIPPHSYITSVGHGLLHQMNTIASYLTDRNFVCAVLNAADTDVSEEEADVWLLNKVGTAVMRAFYAGVGDVSTLSSELVRQFHADIVFLSEAMVDLRLKPTPEILDLTKRLAERTQV
uniref:Conserved oligomeric Golgi complex subunit 7 n=1 Tax=Steinernema glaseri TaxID=37863 RepID=A0A1I8AUD3_9BILA